MANISEAQAQLLMFRGALLEETQENRNKVLDTIEELRKVVVAAGALGVTAFGMLALELAVEAEG